MNAPLDQHAAPVLGVYYNPRAQAHYRLAVPLRAAFGEGAAVTAWHALTQAQRDAAALVVLSQVTVGGDLPVEAAAALVRQIQDGGRRRVLIDVDDDLEPPPGFRSAVWGPESRARLEAMIRAADGVVCTGPTLANRLRRLNRDVRVVPNYVDPAAWPTTTTTGNARPVVALAGSVSHDRDWRLVEPALRELRGRYTLRVCGHLPVYLAPLCDDHRPWTADLSSYPAMLAGADIGLCPLPESRFNACKSPVKAYEFGLSGCAVLGSPTQYGPVLRAAGLGHAVCHTPGQWARALARLIDEPDARRREAATLRAHVLTCDARHHAATIRAAYAA